MANKLKIYLENKFCMYKIITFIFQVLLMIILLVNLTSTAGNRKNAKQNEKKGRSISLRRGKDYYHENTNPIVVHRPVIVKKPEVVLKPSVIHEKLLYKPPLQPALKPIVIHRPRITHVPSLKVVHTPKLSYDSVVHYPKGHSHGYSSHGHHSVNGHGHISHVPWHDIGLGKK